MNLLDELREKIEQYIPKRDMQEMTAVDIYSIAEWLYGESGDLKSEEQYPISLPPWEKAWYEFKWPEYTRDESAEAVSKHKVRVGVYQQCIEVPEGMRELWPNVDLVDALVPRRMLGGEYSATTEFTGGLESPRYVLVSTVFVHFGGPASHPPSQETPAAPAVDYKARMNEELRARGWDGKSLTEKLRLARILRQECDAKIKALDKENEYLRFHPWHVHVRFLNEKGAIVELGRSFDKELGPDAIPGAATNSRLFLPPVALAVSLMHCKNVRIVDNPVPYKIAKKRMKKGRHPGTTFKTLEIDAFRQQVRSEKGDGESDMKRAFHICRGHFSTYTEEKPLFGRVTGTFWIPAHTRGSRVNGEVVKQYKVRKPHA